MEKMQLAKNTANNTLFAGFYKAQLFKFTKYEAPSISNETIKDFILNNYAVDNKDLYGNLKTSGLKMVKTENKFNLLGMFKPGDLLSNVIAQQ